MPRLPIRLILVACIALALGLLSLMALDRWRAASEERAVEQLKARLQAGGGGARQHHELGLQLAGRGDQDEALAHLEMAAQLDPADLLYGNDARRWSVRFGRYDRGISFFEKLAAAGPPEAGLQLALAYVDKMPDHMMGIVGQGRLSKQSIAELTSILRYEGALTNERTRWAALYALGLNHLYWPKALRHSEAAVAAFGRCIQFQKEMKVDGVPAYFVLPYVGMGDAYVKGGRHAEARRVWKEAAALFPQDEKLPTRLSVPDDAALTEFIDQVRGLGVVVDTDLAILWGRKP